MSTSAVWSVWCDYGRDNPDPDAERCGTWCGEEATSHEARAYAKRSGWLIRPLLAGGDRCPKHREEGQP